VQAVAGHFLRGFLGQAVHLLGQLLAQFQQVQAELLPFRLDLFQIRPGARLGTGRPRMAADVATVLRLAARGGFLRFLFSSRSQQKFKKFSGQNHQRLADASKGRECSKAAK
jgi:hypothetical protein